MIVITINNYQIFAFITCRWWKLGAYHVFLFEALCRTAYDWMFTVQHMDSFVLCKNTQIQYPRHLRVQHVQRKTIQISQVKSGSDWEQADYSLALSEDFKATMFHWLLYFCVHDYLSMIIKSGLLWYEQLDYLRNYCKSSNLKAMFQLNSGYALHLRNCLI